MTDHNFSPSFENDPIYKSISEEIKLDRKLRCIKILTIVAAVVFVALTIFWVTNPLRTSSVLLAVVVLVYILYRRDLYLTKNIKAGCDDQISLREPGGKPSSPMLITIDVQPGFPDCLPVNPNPEDASTLLSFVNNNLH